MLEVIRSKTSLIGDAMCEFANALREHSDQFPDSTIVLNDISLEEHKYLISNKKGNPIIRFEGQEPTRYIWNPEDTSEWCSDIIKELSEYDIVFSHCFESYSWRLAKWPHLFKYDRWYAPPCGFESFPELSRKKLDERKYEVSYAGRISGIAGGRQNAYHECIVEQLKKRHSAVISFEPYEDYVTHLGVSNYEKLTAIGDSIICLCNSTSYVTNGKVGRLYRIIQSWNSKGLRGHPCFKNFMLNGGLEEFRKLHEINDQDKIENFGFTVSQFRYRMFEAAFTKTLMLVRDDASLTDILFDRGTEYIPYTSDNLDDIVEDILCNPRKYQAIADKAYERAVNCYTVKNFCKELKGAINMLRD